MQPNENQQQPSITPTPQNTPQPEVPSQPSSNPEISQQAPSVQGVDTQQTRANPVTIQPQDPTIPSSQIGVSAQPSSPASIYPAAQSGFAASSPSVVSKSSIEKEEKQRTRRKQLIVSLISLAAILVLGVGGYFYWYSQQDHSIYAKLTTKTYDQNGVKLNFQYPTIMTVSTSVLNISASVKAAYQYESGATTKMALIVAAVPYASILQHYAITPAQELSQLQSGQGSYADALKAASPSVFKDLYTNCNWLTTDSGQKDLMCSHQDTSDGSGTVVNVFGADSNYQYGLTLGVSNDIWSAHSKVWQKIEKSFSY